MYDVGTSKVSGRIFFDAKGRGEEVINFVIDASRMQLSGVTLQPRSFGPDEGEAAKRSIGDAAADYFGRFTAGH